MQYSRFYFVNLQELKQTNAMKRSFLFLLSALVLASCAKESNVELVKFSDTGCAKGSAAVATKSDDGPSSQIILKYSPEGLEVTRTNAVLNCSISNGGISCDVSCGGNVINYHAYETDGPIMKCLCPVSNMTSTIAGLSLGREYVLMYECSDVVLSPISFTYSKNLNLVLDVELYAQPVNH